MTVKVCLGVKINAVKLNTKVDAVTGAGVNGNGNEIYAAAQHNATHIDIFVSSAVEIFPPSMSCIKILLRLANHNFNFSRA